MPLTICCFIQMKCNILSRSASLHSSYELISKYTQSGVDTWSCSHIQTPMWTRTRIKPHTLTSLSFVLLLNNFLTVQLTVPSIICSVVFCGRKVDGVAKMFFVWNFTTIPWSLSPTFMSVDNFLWWTYWRFLWDCLFLFLFIRRGSLPCIMTQPSFKLSYYKIVRIFIKQKCKLQIL